MADNELMHYGVLGMKWGVRRYQNKDGSLTREGKRHAKQEYKEDNKKAFELGRDATVLQKASRIANRNTERAKKRLEKNPDSEKRKRELDINKRAQASLDKDAADALKRAKAHYNELVKKYGKEAVSQIRYKNGDINERVVTGKEYMAEVIKYSLFGVMSLPFRKPVTLSEKAAYEYSNRYSEEKKKSRG